MLKNKWASVKFNEGYSYRLWKIEDTIDKFTLPWVPTEPPFAFPDLCANENNRFLSSPFGIHEITLALNSCSLKASPGRNRIEYIVIVKPKLILLNLLNEIYSLSIHPSAWKEYLTLFINTEYVDGVRPISLTSYLRKILEKMNKSRLQWWSGTSDLLPSSQSGFRTGISFVDNLTMLTISVEESFSVGKKSHNNHIIISVRT